MSSNHKRSVRREAPIRFKHASVDLMRDVACYCVAHIDNSVVDDGEKSLEFLNAGLLQRSLLTGRRS